MPLQALARIAALLTGLVLAAACAAPPVMVASRRVECLMKESRPQLFCDEAGRLSTCSGSSPLAAAEDIGACVKLEGVAYLVTCQREEQGRAGPAELVPCPGCEDSADELTFVTLNDGLCGLKPAEELVAVHSRRDEPDPPVPLPEEEPAEDGLDLQEPPQEGEERYPECDIFSEQTCPADLACDLDAEPPRCLPAAP